MPPRIACSLSLVVALGACAGSAPFTATERAAVAHEVVAALGDLTAAMNDHDAERVMSFYSRGEDFRYLGCTDFITGGENFRRVVAPYYESGQRGPFEQHVVAVHVLSPNAAAVAQRGSSGDAEALFWTQVLVKENGRWIIIYEHESWPGCPPPTPPHPSMVPADTLGLGLGLIP